MIFQETDPLVEDFSLWVQGAFHLSELAGQSTARPVS